MSMYITISNIFIIYSHVTNPFIVFCVSVFSHVTACSSRACSDQEPTEEHKSFGQEFHQRKIVLLVTQQQKHLGIDSLLYSTNNYQEYATAFSEDE
jgi:hypothetical protein